ncbi:MAG: DUF1512 family protein, partial [Candidatus Nanohaloarchaea archaeon]
MVLPGMFGTDQGILPILINMVVLVGFFALLPRLMIWRSLRKIEGSLTDLREHATGAEQEFLAATGAAADEATERRLTSMKNMVVSPPTGIDPAGL